jgi:hypothetical protein
MLKPHVALQRMRPGKRKFKGRQQFIEWTKKQSDKQKTFMRRQITCLNLNGFVSYDYQLSQALLTKKDLKHKKCRSQARSVAKKKCNMTFRKGQVLHHKDHDPCNNTCRNFQKIANLKHRQMHRKKNVDKLCEHFIFEQAQFLIK